MASLTISNVSKTFPNGMRVLDDISVDIRSGEFLTLLGPSGCGKTTLLKAIAGFHSISSGTILIDGADVTNLPPERRDTAMCFQSYALFPHMTVAENILFGPKQNGVPKDERSKRLQNALRQVDLDAHATKLPAALSGGQQQRVALARAMAMRPGIILFDEPLSNLDAKLREQVRFEMRALQAEHGYILIGGIDLSVATMASFSAVLFVIISPTTGDAGILVALGLAALIGYIQGVIHHRAQIPSFVVSFGTLGILYGTAHYITHATAAPLGPSLIIPFLGAKTAGVPHSLIVAALCAVVLSLTLRFTRLGRDLFAVGCSERAALVAGVKIGQVKAVAFALSSFFAAGAGLMFLSQTGYSSPAMANNYLLPAIVGVVVGGNAISGGVGGVGCALIGGLIAVMVRLGTVMMGLNPAFQNILFGIMVLISVALTIDREKIGIVK